MGARTFRQPEPLHGDGNLVGGLPQGQRGVLAEPPALPGADREQPDDLAVGGNRHGGQRAARIAPDGGDVITVGTALAVQAGRLREIEGPAGRDPGDEGFGQLAGHGDHDQPGRILVSPQDARGIGTGRRPDQVERAVEEAAGQRRVGQDARDPPTHFPAVVPARRGTRQRVVEPYGLGLRGIADAPGVGELIDDEQPAPALLIGPVRRPRIRRGYQPAPVAVAHLDPDAAVPHAAGHLDVRARVDQRVRHDFAGEQGDVGGGVRCLPVLERVPDEPPGRRGRRGIGREGCAGMTRDRHETSGVYF